MKAIMNLLDDLPLQWLEGRVTKVVFEESCLLPCRGHQVQGLEAVLLCFLLGVDCFLG